MSDKKNWSAYEYLVTHADEKDAEIIARDVIMAKDASHAERIALLELKPEVQKKVKDNSDGLTVVIRPFR